MIVGNNVVSSETRLEGEPSRPEEYVVVLGKGRSGTTWIGQILNSSPRCLMKFEPFNPPKQSLYRDWLCRFDETSNRALRDELDALAGMPIHDVDWAKPYFMLRAGMLP